MALLIKHKKNLEDKNVVLYVYCSATKLLTLTLQYSVEFFYYHTKLYVSIT